MLRTRNHNETKAQKASGVSSRRRSFFSGGLLILLFLCCSFFMVGSAQARAVQAVGAESAPYKLVCAGMSEEGARCAGVMLAALSGGVDLADCGAVAAPALTSEFNSRGDSVCLSQSSVSQSLIRNLSKNGNGGRIHLYYLSSLAFVFSPQSPVGAEDYAERMLFRAQPFQFQLVLKKVKPVRAGPRC